MATIRIPDENGRLTEPEAVRAYLAGIGIDYERWEPSHPLMLDAPAEEILAAYSGEIDRGKSRGGYVTSPGQSHQDRKSTRLNSSHLGISYAVFCLKKKNKKAEAETHQH